jgi:hypothetical protein
MQELEFTKSSGCGRSAGTTGDQSRTLICLNQHTVEQAKTWRENPKTARRERCRFINDIINNLSAKRVGKIIILLFIIQCPVRRVCDVCIYHVRTICCRGNFHDIILWLSNDVYTAKKKVRCRQTRIWLLLYIYNALTIIYYYCDKYDHRGVN